MSASQRISELLLQWEEARQQGREPTPEELCIGGDGADSSDIVAELRLHIAAIRAMEERLGIASPATTPTVELPTPATPAAPVGSGPLTPPFSTPQTAAASSSHARPSIAIPGYELMELIDQGGMGVVYRATQTKLQRTVAIKMMTAHASSVKHATRFQAEAEAVARLQHPHIVQIFEIGQAEGRPYFAMEYMAGGTLAVWMTRQRPSPRAAAETAETLARAVHAAHERGVVHRDLKPGNVMLTADGTLKIADFGLAKRLDETPDLTRTGEVLGTPGYMAPEQAAGDRAQIGPATDVYALGAIFYELLAGRPPFVGDNPLEVLRQVSDDEPVPPTRLQSAVPRDLEAICLKCLEKSPARRYASAQELADDLRRFLDGRPILARRAGPIRRLLKYARRHPGRASLAAVAALIAMLPLGWEIQHLRTEWQTRSRAVALAPQAREILRRNCYECHGQNPDAVADQIDMLNHAVLIDGERRIVVPGKPAESLLIESIEEGSMPKDERVRPRLTQGEFTLLKEWILGGAPEAADIAAAPPDDVPTSALAAEVRQIFDQHCYDCHSLEKKKGGILILHHRQLVHEKKAVVPGNPEASRLWRRINLADDDRNRMPPPSYEGKHYDRLRSTEIETIRQWIAEGAPAF